MRARAEGSFLSGIRASAMHECRKAGRALENLPQAGREKA
jgi:hypothetical protein